MVPNAASTPLLRRKVGRHGCNTPLFSSADHGQHLLLICVGSTRKMSLSGSLCPPGAAVHGDTV